MCNKRPRLLAGRRTFRGALAVVGGKVASGSQRCSRKAEYAWLPLLFPRFCAPNRLIAAIAPPRRRRTVIRCRPIGSPPPPGRTLSPPPAAPVIGTAMSGLPQEQPPLRFRKIGQPISVIHCELS